MSISDKNIGLMLVVAKTLKLPDVNTWKDIRIAELGNQIIRINGKQVSKTHWTALGAIHTSFDLNGEDGAVPFDLTTELPDEYVGRYDIVTNFGTSEHVPDQYAVFTNIHRLGKPTSAIVHSVPKQGSWPKHCPYRYIKEFATTLSRIADYEIIECSEVIRPTLPRGGNVLINIVFKKTPQSHWPDESVFNKACTNVCIFKSKDYRISKDNLKSA